jgi:transmembrane sensor
MKMGRENIQHIEKKIRNMQVPALRSKDEAWAELEARMAAKAKPKRKVLQLNWLSGALGAAAVVAILLWMGMFHFGKYSLPIVTEIAQIDTIILPDSSQVILGSNSSLKYSYDKISKERLVQLQGEAIFDVQKGRRFIVNFEGGRVRVLGTSFLVSAYSEQMSEVTCIDGRVHVRFGRENVRLEKGQGVRIYNDQVTGPYDVDMEQFELRQSGTFYWNQIELRELLDLVAYRNGYSLVIDGPIQGRQFSGYVEPDQLHDCLLILATSMELNYSIDDLNKTIEIDAR